jgi:hypothetical protein
MLGFDGVGGRGERAARAEAPAARTDRGRERRPRRRGSSLCVKKREARQPCRGGTGARGGPCCARYRRSARGSHGRSSGKQCRSVILVAARLLLDAGPRARRGSVRVAPQKCPGLALTKECRSGSFWAQQPVPVDGCFRSSFQLGSFVSLTLLARATCQTLAGVFTDWHKRLFVIRSV